MPLIACPECKKKISDSSNGCPNCGFLLTPEVISEIKKKEQKNQKAGCMGCFSIIAILFVIFLIASNKSNNDRASKVVSPPESIENKWYEGGTLHRATIREWLDATHQNKLATASDWLAGTKWKGHLNSYEDFARLKIKAEMLVNTVDKSIEIDGTEKIEAMNITEFAAALLVMSNDFEP